MQYTLALLTAFVGAALAAPLERREDIDHDKVVSLPQKVTNDTEGKLLLKWQPVLDIENGCVPFPAVDAEGRTSAGLKPSGSPSGDCDTSTGQVYARAKEVNGTYAMMFSWFMPKDEPGQLQAALGGGHRYDWESAVVWLSGPTEDATLLGVAASYHGGYKTSTKPAMDGDRVKLRYYTEAGILNHSLGFTDKTGGSQPLVSWAAMDPIIQKALADKDWGDANVPFKDDNFDNNLVKAKL